MVFEGITEKLVAAVRGEKKDKMQSVQEQNADEKDLVTFVKSEVEERRNTANRISSEGQWLTNSAYLLGYTNLFYDTSLRVFRPVNMPNRSSRGSRVEFNYILPNVQNRLARLTKSPPKYDVIPNSTSDEDREAARTGMYLLNQIWEEQRINKKRLAMTMSMQQCGHAFLKTCWDPSLGPKIPIDKDGEMHLYSLGDIRVDVASPFEVFPDLLAKTQEEVISLVHAKIRPISYYRTQYPERGYLVQPEGVWLQSLEYESRINSFNAQIGTGSGVSNYLQNAAIELSYYEKPNYKNPFGRHLICANGVLLKDDYLPIDEIPFAKFDDILVGGKYNSEAVITHLRNLQDQYNRNLTKRSQWINRMLNGKYLAAKGHGLAKEALNDQSGEVVEFNPVPNAPPPAYLAAPPIPQYAYQEDDYIKSMMNEIAGVAEISKGNMPSAGIPAIGMQFLQEQDDTRIGTITENNEYGYADLGRHILKFANKYYDYPRTLKIAGKGMEYAVKSFKGADLLGNYDVKVVRGSTLPGSKVLRRQEIINLHQSGYLGDPQDPKVLESVLNMLEYGDVGEAWKDQSLDLAQIDNHIKMIEEEVKPPVSEFDNHTLFIKEMNRYRKGDKFQKLSEQAQFLLLECMERHLQMATDLMAPDTSDEGTDLNPAMQEKTAAQENEVEVHQEVGQEMNADQNAGAPPAQVPIPED